MRTQSLVVALVGCFGTLHMPDNPTSKGSETHVLVRCTTESSQVQREEAAQHCRAHWCGMLYVGCHSRGDLLGLTSPHTAKPSSPARPHRTMLMMQQIPKKICTPVSIQHTKSSVMYRSR